VSAETLRDQLWAYLMSTHNCHESVARPKNSYEAAACSQPCSSIAWESAPGGRVTR
jgi:hypothetical protein